MTTTKATRIARKAVRVLNHAVRILEENAALQTLLLQAAARKQAETEIRLNEARRRTLPFDTETLGGVNLLPIAICNIEVKHEFAEYESLSGLRHSFPVSKRCLVTLEAAMLPGDEPVLTSYGKPK